MPQSLRVGTDCSGIEAPIQALIKLKIPFTHVFSSEIDKYCIESIKANYSPEIIFGDILTRDTDSLPDIDLYVCGFPCQPFSMLGSRKGIKDNRGTVFESCLQVIKEKEPSYFILENVHGILSIDKGKTFKNIISSLESLGLYKIFWKVLNTSDYGIPQNRKRVFIVGTKKDFAWPSPIPLKKPLKSFVDTTDTSKNDIAPRAIKSDLLNRIPEDSVFIDLSTQGRTSFPSSGTIAPCIMRKSDFYCVPQGRRANIKELLALQGFPSKGPKGFKQVVSDTQIKRQIGNSMSVNVLSSILKNLVSCY